MLHLPVTFMNRLNQTESSVFKLWMLYSKGSPFQITCMRHQVSKFVSIYNRPPLTGYFQDGVVGSCVIVGLVVGVGIEW